MKSNEDRQKELRTAANGLLRAVRAGDWEEAANLAGQAQRRSRILAGKGRGG